MLALEVELLTGRYIATAFDDRSRPEWPPHPSRLFSALVATHYESSEVSAEERDAIDWLATQGPPEIVASDASIRDVTTVFVPVNDPTVVGSFDDEANAVDEARRALDDARAANAKATTIAALEKKIAKAQARFAEAIKKAIAPLPPGKEGKDGPPRAASLLPERRTRQPRTFPSVTPHESRIIFQWPNAQVSVERQRTIDRLASRVVRLGHSSSLVSVRIKEGTATPTWVPDETGEVVAPSEQQMLRVFESGQLAALDTMFEQSADVPGRVMPASFQRYVRPSASSSHPTPTTIFGQDWLVLRRVDGPRLPSVRAVELARGVRSALLRSFGDDAPEILSGHRAPGERSERPHLAIVPLPFVGHERADGALLGVALVLPSAAARPERHSVYRAVDRWRRSLRDADGGKLPVHLGRTGILELVLLEEDPSQSTLSPRTWCRRSCRWSSATPIALDRNPGDLRSDDPAKQARAYAEAEETVARACENIGLPRPSMVTVMPFAPLAGGDKTRAFPPYSTGNPPIRRVLVHATLTFAEPVEGPILLGSGRFLGLGLFRPSRDND